MANSLTAVIGADTTRFTQSINQARSVLQSYSREAQNASNQITRNTSVTDSQVNSYQRVVKALEKVNSGNMSTTQQAKVLEKQIKELKIQWQNLSDSAKSSDFGKAISDSCKAAENQLKRLRDQIDSVDSGMTGMARRAGSSSGGGKFLDLAKSGFAMATGIGSAAAAFGVLTSAIGNNVETAKNFETAVSRIKALTGATEQTMGKLKKAAVDLGANSTQSATGVMEAFGMIGSKSPELLKSADALAECTKNAIMLSEAASIELSVAATALTGILNQFGISAQNSAEVVNLLAAASQQGAGDVAYLNTAIVNCGSVAGSLKISVNQVVAVLEQLAQAGVDASSAGNQLKNIMLKLESDTDQKLKPSVVGLTTAIKNLGKQNLSTTELTKKFGTENVSAALTLISTADAADKLTESITGTNTAEEQQRVNNDNLQGSLNNLSSKWEAFNLTLNSSNGLLRDCVDCLADVVGWFTDLISTTDEATRAQRDYNNELNGMPKKGTKANHDISDKVNSQVESLKSKPTKEAREDEYKKELEAYQRVIDEHQGYSAEIRRRIGKNQHSLLNATTDQDKAFFEKQAKMLQEEMKLSDKYAAQAIRDREDYTRLGRTAILNANEADKPKPNPTKTTPTHTTVKPKHTTTEKPKAAEGSIGDLESKLNELQNKYSDGLLPDLSPDDYASKVKELEDKIQKLKIEKKVIVDPVIEKKEGIDKELDKLLAKKGDSSFKIAVSADLPEDPKTDKQILKGIQDQMDANDALIEKLKDVIKKYEEIGDVSSDAYKNAVKGADDAAKSNEGLAKEAVTVAKRIVKTEKEQKKFNRTVQAVNSAESTVNSIGGAFNKLGSAIGGADGEMLSMIGNMLGGIAELIPQIMALVGAKEAEAVASGTASASQAPWFMVIPQIAAVVGTIIGIFASIGSFAEGGIIQGKTTVGDMNLARVNGGEMILNGSQQARLFNLLNASGGFAGQQNSIVGGEVKIKGSDIYLALKNYSKLSPNKKKL